VTSSRSANGRNSTRRRELVENQMYEQAARLFAERGFAGTSLQDIADAMGITRPALYYYVKSKDDLLAKLVSEITEGPAADMKAVAERADLDAVGKLRAIARLIAVRQASQPVRFRLLVLSEAELPEELARAHERGRRAVLKTLSEVIDGGVVSGQFRPVDPRVAALGVLGLCNWVAWWFRPGRDSVDAVAEALADMAVASLRRAEHRVPADEGPAAALALLRQDLDHLERLLGAD
jgi:AcrR family transcriptional regulator